MTHPAQKIETLLALISNVNGTVSLSDSEKELRETNPEKLVSILSHGYIQICKIRGVAPTRRIEWLMPAIVEAEEEAQAAEKFGL